MLRTGLKQLCKHAALMSLAISSLALSGQSMAAEKSTTDEVYDGLSFRMIGPYRGGRSAAVTGVEGKENLYYMGTAGGGVWKTTDSGQSWSNISDDFFGGSVGAVAVAPSDPNVIYVGGGEKTVRGNVSHGYGIWRSTDAGKSWQFSGLKDSRRIPRIRVHPTNPEIVYAAVLGHLFGPNEERGVFKSTDGGKTWKKVLFVNDEVGAVDLILDPTNPRIMFATTWRIKRTPYSLSSGGEGSGLWQSKDGGETWQSIDDKKGLPRDVKGIAGIAISPVNPDRIWAMIEAKDGGLFRTDDGGETWSRLNSHNKLRQRAWYYTRLYADTQNQDVVYVLNVRFHKSSDGGKTFNAISTPHSDHHDLWIDPNNNQRMIIGDDGGGQISKDGGQSWTTYFNQPTAQFYRVSTDNHFPYRILVAQQDNTAIRINHRSDSFVMSSQDWEVTAGGESGHITAHPDNPDLVFGGSYMGFMSSYDHKTKQTRIVNPWPDLTMGAGAEAAKYRFQWNYPLTFSAHHKDTLFAAANVLMKSTDSGQSWAVISPDLTRAEPEKLRSSGGPITQDNTSVEYYATIFAFAESAKDTNTLWTGSDDGLVHVSKDSGLNWKDVTPSRLPDDAQINSIEADPFNAGGLYLAATRYKSDDFTPYLYYTKNYGKSWKRIDKGIDRTHFTRVIRADRFVEGLLYAGTESGLYLSRNNGKSWQPLKLNLPVVPVTDIALKEKDLIIATQGRSVWMFDDLTPIHEFAKAKKNETLKLITPRDTYRLDTGMSPAQGPRAENVPNGVMVHFWLAEEPLLHNTHDKDKEGKQAVTITLKQANGDVIRTFNTASKEDNEQFTAKKGFNRFVWDMTTPPPEGFDGMILWTGGMEGYKVVPGQYSVSVSYGDTEQNAAFQILKDPRTSATDDDFAQQYAFSQSLSAKLTDVHQTIDKIRTMRKTLNALNKQLGDNDKYTELKTLNDKVLADIKAIEEALYQTENQSPQDPLGKPIRLNDKLNTIYTMSTVGDKQPTTPARQVAELLIAAIDEQLEKFEQLKGKDIKKINELRNQLAVETLSL